MSEDEIVWEKIVLPKIPPTVIDLSSDTDGDVPDQEDEAHVLCVEDDDDVVIEDSKEGSNIDSFRRNDCSNYSPTSPVAISDETNSNFDEMSDTGEIDDEDSRVRVAQDIFGNSDDEFDIKYETIEVVQLNVNFEPETVPIVPARLREEEEYVTFFDPSVDFENEDEGESHKEPQNPEDSGTPCGTSKTEVRSMRTHKSDSPQPSTSTACQDTSNGRRLQKNKDKKAKRVRFQTNNSESDSSETINEAPVSGRKRKATLRKKSLRSSSSKRRKVQTPSESDGSSSSSSLFEEITVFRKKVKPSSSQDEEKSTKSKSSKPRPSRIKRSSLQLDSDSKEKSDKEDSGAEVEKDSKKSSKRFTRSKLGTQSESKMKKAAAFEKLREKRERMANKPKRQSPIRPVKTEKKEDSDDDDESSSYTSGSSPCPIVDNSSEESSNFDSSTPSSSSVTSDAETEEEADLEIGGSDGEKDLPKETPSQDNSSESDRPVKSCSSSSEDEPPDDGQNDDRCILCKNLGPKLNLTGRARDTVTERTFGWCKCGECDLTSNRCGNYDLVCCREIKAVVDFLNEELDDSDVCVTKHSRFKLDVLKNEAYARAMSKHQQARRYDGNYYGNFYERYSCKPNQRLADQAKADFDHANSYGKFSKSINSYLFWIFDKLGRDAGQMVIPACVHRKILDRYTIPEYKFSPFYAGRDCGIGDRRHCNLSRNTYM